MNISNRFPKLVLGGLLTLGLLATVQTAHSFVSDLPTVWITASDPDAAETGPDWGTVTVWRDGGDLSLPLYVWIEWPPGGTAVNGVDYVQIPQHWWQIPAWENSISMAIQPYLDTDCNEGI